MGQKINVEVRIAELEEQIGSGIASERQEIEDAYRSCPIEYIRNNSSIHYLMFLEALKREMDKGSRLWNKWRNWD